VTGRPGNPAVEVVNIIKPKLRGWFHSGLFPLVIAAGIVLISLAGTVASTVACAIYSATAVLLFGTSGLYHRFAWSPPMLAALKRFDHANIFLIIAGTYTPCAVLLLDHGDARTLLSLVWAGALTGVIFRVFWVEAPRWLHTPIYVALGWAAVFYLPQFLHNGGAAVVVLLVVGGVLYSVGAVVYGIRRPDPFPRWFGFHEVFHTFTVAAAVVHYVAISLATYTQT
jgi:hemolysin III